MEDLVKSTLLLRPELTLILTGIIVMVADPLVKGDGKKELFWIALIGLIGAFVFNLSRFGLLDKAFSGALSLDSFSAYFNMVFIVGAFLALLLSRDYVETMNLRPNEYYALVLISTSGMMILASAEEFMSLFLGFEIMSISVYILSGFNRSSIRSTESGIKYLVLGSFSSGILLYGIALVYGASGTIWLQDIAKNFDLTNPLYFAGLALILAGFIFKIGAFPFHQWIPDVYEGAPVAVTGFMSVCVKAAAFSILLRVFFVGFPEAQINWEKVLWIVAVFTMSLGNLSAIAQRSIKRMLAYSSIAHAGYALVGVVSAGGEKELGLGSVLYYLLAYTFMNLGAFGVLACLSKNGKECENFEDVGGLWQRKPLTAVALTVFMFSLAGVPPTAGFFAKYWVFLAGIRAGFYWLVIIGILNSVLSAYYYLRVLVFAYMREGEKGQEEFPLSRPASAVALIILTLGTMILGIIPLRYWELAQKAVSPLL